MSEKVDRIHPNDVKFGRGKGDYNHPGNKYFRSLIKDRISDYDRADKNRGDKKEISRQIIRAIAARDGRFVKYDKNKCEWVAVVGERAEKKVSQVFRDQLGALKKKKKQAAKRVLGHSRSTESLPDSPGNRNQPDVYSPSSQLPSGGSLRSDLSYAAYRAQQDAQEFPLPSDYVDQKAQKHKGSDPSGFVAGQVQQVQRTHVAQQPDPPAPHAPSATSRSGIRDYVNPRNEYVYLAAPSHNTRPQETVQEVSLLPIGTLDDILPVRSYLQGRDILEPVDYAKQTVAKERGMPPPAIPKASDVSVRTTDEVSTLSNFTVSTMRMDDILKSNDSVLANMDVETFRPFPRRHSTSSLATANMLDTDDRRPEESSISIELAGLDGASVSSFHGMDASTIDSRRYSSAIKAPFGGDGKFHPLSGKEESTITGTFSTLSISSIRHPSHEKREHSLPSLDP